MEDMDKNDNKDKEQILIELLTKAGKIRISLIITNLLLLILVILKCYMG
ncbi:MAG: hypothetical protein K2H13_05705 [Eubacterium sp.]|nr:hypothetical protein [Eubacterium sp.]MDE6155236.1 hypothetical protein [Eubacterium sp.]